MAPPPVAAGPLAIFDHIAGFLERCRLSTAADMVRSDISRLQAPGQQNTLLEDAIKNLKPLVDAAVVLMAELDAGAYGTLVSSEAIQGETPAKALELTIDTLMRKLMASRYCLSDEKMTLMLGEVVLDSGVVPKVADGQKEKVLSSEALGVNDADVQKYWAQIHEEATGGAEAKAEGALAKEGDAGNDATAADPAAPAAPPPSTGPSSHYHVRQPRGTPGAEEEWEQDDEYHDDDDPGYRIREIYESELLAELSAKTAAGQAPGAPTQLAQATDGSKAAGQEGATAVDDTTASVPPSKAAEAATVGASAEVPVTGDIKATTVEATKPGEAEKEQLAEQKQQMKRNVKYAASADPFYPVELDGVIYDSFNLRVVFERDKTGFEESKEFPIRMNSVIAARYQILEYLGSAAFSRAVQCLDLETNKLVCMKIIKNDKDFFDQSLDEIKLLKYINVNGDVDDHCVLRLYDYFYHKEHLIIVTELLRDNLYEFSKYNRECGDEPYFTLGHLQKIAKQVLTALDYVHSLRLMHCDLKPENILIKSYSRCEVKVIDFGSSCFIDDHLSSYVQSRSYRAPEVMLGLPYDQKIDLWSLGCILAELWTGYVLFQNDSVQSLLVRIIGIIGEFPYHLMTRGRYVPQYFTQDGQLYQEIDGPACPDRGRRLHLLVPKKTSLKQRMRTECEEFLDFLSQLLKLDPAERPTATEALQHPWLSKCKYTDGVGTGPPPPVPQPPTA
mmetsp:Transcript_57401/g.134606  ORF Transcript_57401/g.134606 Transcript_57401/m.134606 type:complete len:730 (-) Transcript_57401:79-2268(-)